MTKASWTMLLGICVQCFASTTTFAFIPAQKISPPRVSTKDAAFAFDIPLTYNERVQYWIHYYQTTGKTWFRNWLERAQYRVPQIQKHLAKAGLPLDLAYLSMIESGFSTHAKSSAAAVGPWQFMEATGKRFGLKTNSWIDERRDFDKSTEAAIKYLSQLHNEFNNWYLVAASYNTGEGRIRRIVKKHQTTDFWKLAKTSNLMYETKEYIPKFLAAVLMAKAPSLYGFRNIPKTRLLESDTFFAPGGTNLNTLAEHLGVTKKSLVDLNPELLKPMIPSYVPGHFIHIPKGSSRDVGVFFAQRER